MHPTIYLSALLAMGFNLAAAHPANLHMARNHGRDVAARSIGNGAPTRNTRLHRREVPQEHSHELFLTIVNEFLRKDNPDNIQDAVFGLLGNAAASAGQGKITDTDCLQQATADRAFTNAKNENDLDGQIASLIYRALERNTGAVGQASVLCTSIKAVNPEIAAISQHQDPASPNAAETNKGIALELAVQIFSVGGDPVFALDSGTFEAGQIGDPTGKGNTCDDLDDPHGCIFTQDLGIEDATEDEIRAFVSSKGVTPPPAATTTAAGGGGAAPSATTTTTAAAGGATTTSAAPPTATTPAAGNGNGNGGNGTKLNLGTCKDATVIFAANLDGRREAKAFAPKDKSSFDHGAAENIKVITDFICKF
jgi:hypothetical protein